MKESDVENIDENVPNVEHGDEYVAKPKQRKSPMSKPEMLNVVRLDEARIIKKRGRPKKLHMPPMPKEIFDGMSQLEKDLFDYFIETFREKYAIEEGPDLISLYLAGFDYIQTLRVQAEQMRSGQIISMARQHPAVQLRAWLDQMDVTRKANKGKNGDKSEADKMREDFMKKFS